MLQVKNNILWKSCQQIFINKSNGKDYVDSCLISYDSNDNPICIADKEGNSGCVYSTKCTSS